MHDEVKCKGDVLVEFLNESNEVVERQVLQNKVVASGRAFIAQLLDAHQFASEANRPADMNAIAMGSSITATEDADTTLRAETARVTISSRIRNGAQVAFVAEFPTGLGTGMVGEFGIFNAPGVMLARVTASALQEKKTTTSIRITWYISLV